MRSNLTRRKELAERMCVLAVGLGAVLTLVDIWAFLAGSTGLLQWMEILTFSVLIPLTVAVGALAPGKVPRLFTRAMRALRTRKS